MRWLTLITLAVLVLTGCATLGPTPFHVSVDSLASPQASAKRTYVLLPGNEGVTWDDLQFQEYALYVVRVLGARGYTWAEQFEDAEIAVVLTYGIGDPQTRQYTYSLPVWGQTGVASSQTYGTVNQYGRTATYSGTTTYTPTYGITGYRTQTASVTSFFRYAQITAYDLGQYRDGGRTVQVWRTTIGSSGSSGDLRRVFPILIGAGATHLGTNTGRRVDVTMYEDDPLVRAIRGEEAR